MHFALLSVICILTLIVMNLHLPGKWHLLGKLAPWIHICEYKYYLYFACVIGKQGVIMFADIKSSQAFLYSKH